VAKTSKPAGRFSIGFYAGNDEIFVYENGKRDNTVQLRFNWYGDKTITDKIWAGVIMLRVKIFYGSLNLALS
jgi:hypothetical protein